MMRGGKAIHGFTQGNCTSQDLLSCNRVRDVYECALRNDAQNNFLHLSDLGVSRSEIGKQRNRLTAEPIAANVETE